jgi:hypothetical protein
MKKLNKLLLDTLNRAWFIFFMDIMSLAAVLRQYEIERLKLFTPRLFAKVSKRD